VLRCVNCAGLIRSGVVGGGGGLRPPPEAERKGRQNEYFKFKKIDLCAQKFLNR
jgi:hypothetical protein